ncbi:MAG: hypothetical protein AAGA70_08245 [Pseudomonadota bacterium]
MGQTAEIVSLAVAGENQLWDFLDRQSADVTSALAHRAALRAVAEAVRFDQLNEDTARYALAAARAALISGVLIEFPEDEGLRAAAAEAAEGTLLVRRFHQKLCEAEAPAAEAMVRVISALEAVAATDRDTAAEMAGHAMLDDPTCYADCALSVDEMLVAPVELSEDETDLINQFAQNDTWAFWRAWHVAALKGTPLPWSVQAEIARLPQDAWDAGPAVVAARIGRVFARMELQTRIEALEKRMMSKTGPNGGAKEDDVGRAPANFAAIRLIREPIDDLLTQARSPKPQAFLIQKATLRLTMILAASGKWLGRSAEGDIKEMVRVIGKSGGVATANWIDGQGHRIRAVIEAAEDWRHRIPA